MRFTPKTWKMFLGVADFECWMCGMGYALEVGGEITPEDLKIFREYGLRNHLRGRMKGIPCQEIERHRLILQSSVTSPKVNQDE